MGGKRGAISTICGLRPRDFRLSVLQLPMGLRVPPHPDANCVTRSQRFLLGVVRSQLFQTKDAAAHSIPLFVNQVKVKGEIISDLLVSSFYN
jgi:hypothetical protein